MSGTSLPVSLVRDVLRVEWVAHLCDLVERRLMLLYKRNLSHTTLHHLAQLMVDEGLLPSSEIENQVAVCRDRLQTHFGKRVAATADPTDSRAAGA